MKSVLIIRRDNIGDMICTTPLFFGLRSAFPFLELTVLTNSYAGSILKFVPEVDRIISYDKYKHRNVSLIAIFAQKIFLLSSILLRKFDYVIYTEQRSWFLALITRGRRILTYDFNNRGDLSWLLRSRVHFIKTKPLSGYSESERVWEFAKFIGLTQDKMPEPRLTFQRAQSNFSSTRRSIGIHIGARKSSQRWAPSNFAMLINKLGEIRDSRIQIFYTPGDFSNPEHPGDEGRLSTLKTLTHSEVSIRATTDIEALVNQIAMCDYFVCADGGAMHIASALNIPLVALFGRSDANRWRPGRSQYVLLQHPSLEVRDISVDTVYFAVLWLMKSV